ncbi:hypothetical protein [Lutibacter sp.]|uniref:hypothetical protein n=1 Tax=Lutibacter sp. TaxID=1925666 RepID=UPI0027350F9E|nr:hypothetical protein [Lutibacter sp.]MDP3312216.1 hypothetical protein [Lutibacter sp.]
MKLFNFKNLLFTLILFGTFSVYSQVDTSKIKILDGEKNIKKGNIQIPASSAKMKITPPIDFDLNIDNKINPEAISKSLKSTNPTIKNHNFLMETLPENKDIIVKKYWEGKDVTNKKLESNMSLGTISSTSKTVRIECRDHSYVDGDRIRIFQNEQIVSTNIGLKGNYYVLYLTLVPGYNRIDFQALNQGLSGPNTAELTVYDENGTVISSKEWNLPTGYTATLGIIKK